MFVRMLYIFTGTLPTATLSQRYIISQGRNFEVYTHGLWIRSLMQKPWGTSFCFEQLHVYLLKFGCKKNSLNWDRILIQIILYFFLYIYQVFKTGVGIKMDFYVCNGAEPIFSHLTNPHPLPLRSSFKWFPFFNKLLASTTGGSSLTTADQWRQSVREPSSSFVMMVKLLSNYL